jgi:hypothetical protein
LVYVLRFGRIIISVAPTATMVNPGHRGPDALLHPARCADPSTFVPNHKEALGHSGSSSTIPLTRNMAASRAIVVLRPDGMFGFATTLSSIEVWIVSKVMCNEQGRKWTAVADVGGFVAKHLPSTKVNRVRSSSKRCMFEASKHLLRPPDKFNGLR